MLTLYRLDPTNQLLPVGSGEGEWPIIQEHDTADGSYYVSRFALINDTAIVGYTNVRVTLLVEESDENYISENAIVYQLLPLRSNMENLDEYSMAMITPTNELILSNFVPSSEDQTRYFALRTFVPKLSPVSYITEARLTIKAFTIDEA